MSIIPGLGRPWHRGDHCLLYGLRYTVRDVDITGTRAQLVLGDSATRYSALGRIIAPISELAWRA